MVYWCKSQLASSISLIAAVKFEKLVQEKERCFVRVIVSALKVYLQSFFKPAVHSSHPKRLTVSDPS